MAQQPTLSEEYTTGVYYDSHAGEFVEIEDCGDTIGLSVPGEEYTYYTFDEDTTDKAEAIGIVEEDMRPISETAVENPAQVVKSALRRASRNDINELSSVPEQESIDLMYARSQVNIVEE